MCEVTVMKRTIKVPTKPKKVVETKEERLERIRMAATTRTRVVPDKKHTYNRQKFKKEVCYA